MINQQAALKLISQIACVSTGIVKVDGGDRARLLLISKLIAETSLVQKEKKHGNSPRSK